MFDTSVSRAAAADRPVRALDAAYGRPSSGSDIWVDESDVLDPVIGSVGRAVLPFTCDDDEWDARVALWAYDDAELSAADATSIGATVTGIGSTRAAAGIDATNNGRAGGAGTTGTGATNDTAAGTEVTRPEATGPEATGPEATGPAATGPAATGPAATGPEATGPEATGSDAVGSDAVGARRGPRLSPFGSAEIRHHGPDLLPPGLLAEGAELWPGADLVGSTPSGSVLAGLLECVDLASMTDRGVLEVTAAWERLAAWAYLGSAAAAAHLASRSSMNPPDERPRNARFSSTAGDEVALRLGWSRRAGANLVREGRALDRALSPVADAVRAGDLDRSKVRVFVEHLDDQPEDLVDAVLDRVLPGAATRTPTELGRDLERAILEVDPESAAARHDRAVTRRRVDAPRRLQNGMSGMWAVLPAHAARLVDGTLDATARAARADGDPRTLAQLRADVLVGIIAGTSDLAPTDIAASLEHGPDGAPAAPHGGWPGAHAVEPDTDRTASHHAAEPRPAAHRTDDHRATDPRPDEPHTDDHRAADAHPAEPRTDEPRTDDHRVADARGRVRVRRPRIQVNVTVSLTTLLGLDERCGDVDGQPMSAAQVRALALEGPWRRIVTDPLTDTVLDVGTTRYRPPAHIGEHVRVRDRVCVWPGCVTPAERADLDHTVEAQHGGRTSASNLGPLCRHHHRLKSSGRYVLSQPSPGVFELRTPTGQILRTQPGLGGRVERIDRAYARRDVEYAAYAPPDDGPPPF
ncbi:HNH endonuclease signature motif containing protein [Cellulomonas composti]|uniref:HNH nuclease domain-containing protein n=1 Tax=Cellulomonas composti TaxID=266130 RepID=A0A511J8Q9_9CELL|nr:HNH endonuclease signature motif containing protein [Cellulomonas composti]GEL94385.1 hypothetical protein CCO02nite_10430 [Cellulomonas composti]